MVGAAVAESGRSHLFLVDQGVKLNQQNYRVDILVGALLPWTRKYFKKRPWSFQQDSAPSHDSGVAFRKWAVLHYKSGMDPI